MDMNDVIHRKRARRILGDLKKSGLRTRLRTGRVDFRLLAEARPVTLWRVLHVLGWGSIWKSQNRKNVYLSPYVEEPLNSKVIKSFVPELRSRKCFSCFRIPMFYIYIYIYIYIYMNIICTFRIFMYGYVTLAVLKHLCAKNYQLSLNKNSFSKPHNGAKLRMVYFWFDATSTFEGYQMPNLVIFLYI